MATIVTRAGKGSPLTNTEVDSNFENLNAEVTPLRHSIRPSLLLDFANSKTLDPRIDFTRSSTATYYDGKTHAKAEENLLTYSQEFDQWSIIGTVTTNNIVAPDGTTTADTFISTSSAASRVQQTVSLPSTTHIFSVYLKYSNVQWIRFGTEGGIVWFDIQNGVVGAEQSGVSGQIVDAGNGWYRCIVTKTAGVSNDRIFFAATSSNGSQTPSSGDEFYIWGAQLEQRSSVTAYTPTTSQPITNYIPVLQTAASGTARFDHDPVTGESKGLLIEEQRTNLVTNSENPTNPAASVSVSDSGLIAPTGDNYFRVIELSNNSTGKRFLSRNYTTNGTTTFSFYIKNYSGSNFISFRENTTTGFAFWFQPSTGSFSSFSGAASSSTCRATALPDGSYRVDFTITFPSSASRNFSFDITRSGSIAYVGDDWRGFFISSFQLEAGAFPTSYIPTSGSQVTRSADSATITGDNFSSWYRADEGSFFLSIVEGFDNSFDIIGTNNYSRFLYYQGGTYKFYNNINSPGIAKTLENGSVTKISFALNGSGTALSVNSQFVETSDLFNPSSSLNIGNAFYGGLNSTIKKLAYYPTRLTNAELVSLTEE